MLAATIDTLSDYAQRHGAKGRRLYDWTRVELIPPAAGGMARWLRCAAAAATGS